MFSGVDRIPACNRHRDRRTDILRWHSQRYACASRGNKMKLYIIFTLLRVNMYTNIAKCKKVKTVPFLPHNAMHSVDYVVTRCLFVCLSVRLAHAGIVSKLLNVPSNFFSPPSSHTFLFFCTKRYGNIATGSPQSNGDVECRMRGYDKITIFEQCLALSRKWYKTWPYLCQCQCQSSIYNASPRKPLIR